MNMGGRMGMGDEGEWWETRREFDDEDDMFWEEDFGEEWDEDDDYYRRDYGAPPPGRSR